MAKTPRRKSPATQPVQEPEESKRDKFVRIGTARMNRVLNSIRLLGNLASYNYEWTAQDISKMQDRIVEVLGQSLARFERVRAKSKRPAFEFEPLNSDEEEKEEVE